MSLKIDFDQDISVPTDKWFNQIPGLEQIPNKTIIYKTKTGLGATFSEVLSKRHSIIMLPHVSIIKNKHSKYQDTYKTFAVFGDGQQTKIKDIILYICSDIEHKKFLTTPRGLEKIKTAFSQLGETGKLQELYDDYFLLIDECHKLCKDTGYRDDMIPPMDDFFEFKGKAMVSATVIPLSDPRFKDQDFRHVKLNPIHSYKNYGKWYDQNDLTCLNKSIKNKTLKVVHPYKKDIKLLQVNSITNGLKDYIKENPVKKYCIFFNSIMGIKSLIADLNILEESRIFCSSESCKLLKLDQLTHKQNYDATDAFDKKDANSLATYNFFTSSFYTGLDIDLCFKPTIIILTDCYQAEYSIADPYTDVIQIIGRFRNDMYKEVVHINNYSSFTHPLNDEELDKKINASQISHSLIGSLLNLPIDSDVKQVLSEAMTTLYPFATFLDQKGTYCPYKEDNYRDLNRIKCYYDQPYKLIAGYRNSKLFNLSIDRKIYEKSELIYLKRSPGKYSPENNKIAAEALAELETIKGSDLSCNKFCF